MIESSVGPLDSETVAAGYLRHSVQLRTGSPDALYDAMDRDTAAYEALDRTVRRGPALVAWDLVLRLLRLSPDEDLGLYAAGPLEDLVRLRGAELVDGIEAAATADERFQWALGRIWLDRGDLPSDVTQRIIRASGNRIKPLALDADRSHRDPVT